MSDTATHIRAKLIDLFEQIEHQRMEGVPVLNKALFVDAAGFDQHGDFSLGVLLTPWFMNLMLLPTGEGSAKLAGVVVGSKQHHNLPGGRFEFIVGHEEAIGHYLSCSLFSPVFEFGDQETAMATARAVLEQVLTPLQQEDQEDEDADMRAVWAGRLPTEPEPQNGEDQSEPGPPAELSRRDVLRGLRKGQATKGPSDVEVQP